MVIIINTKTLGRRLINIFLAGAITVFLFYCGVGITHAITDDVPDVLIIVNERGGVSCEGDLFGDKLWYPGVEEDGVIRIVNKGFRKFELSDLSLDVTLNQYKPAFNRDVVYNSFLDNMKLTLEKGRMLVFDDVLFDNRSLSDLVGGFQLEDLNKYIVGSNRSLDLKYTLLMDESSGEELESVIASVDFLINVGESIEEDSGDNGDNGNGSSPGDDSSGQSGSGEKGDNGDAGSDKGEDEPKGTPGDNGEEMEPAGGPGDDGSAPEDAAIPSGVDLNVPTQSGDKGQLPYTGGTYWGFILGGIGLVAGGWLIGCRLNRRK